MHLEAAEKQQEHNFESTKLYLEVITMQSNIRIIELLRFLYQQTDEAHALQYLR